MKTVTVLIFMIAVTVSSALATAQIPDKIVFQGQEYSLHTNPMEPYFLKNPDKRPKDGLMTTALWRGYVATLAFNADDLVLKDIEAYQWRVAKEKGQSPLEWNSVIDSILPKGEKLLVDWFTGILILPHGNLENYVHMGYGSTYSNYILLEVKKGKLTGKRTYDHKQYEEFKERQFQAYKKSKAYRELVYALEQEGITSEKHVDPFLRSFVATYPSEFVDEDQVDSEKSDEGDDR